MLKRGYSVVGICVALGVAVTLWFVFRDRQEKSASPSESSSSHANMITALEKIARRTPDDNPYLGDRQARELRRQLHALAPNAPVAQVADLCFALAEMEIVLGRENEAIALYERAGELGLPVLSQLPKHFEPTLAFQLGVAYMRLGETENCCAANTPESCILPIRGAGIHKNSTGSRRAIGLFKKVLRMAPSNSPRHFEARWLLNIAYMTLGEYPGGVPTEYRIPESTFRSSIEFPQFRNIAKRLGLDTFSLAGGAIGDDIDNDGLIDLVVSTWDVRGQIRFFRNRGNGGFEDRTEQAGLKGIYGGLNMIQADYDNDGFVDVLVLRGGWFGPAGKHPNSLLRNLGNGAFRDVTFDAFGRAPHYPTQTASWADYDNDGNLDLYVGNETTKELKSPSQLFRNNGNGTFTDVAVAAGVTNVRFTKGVIWGDYNADRFPDLYVSNMDEPNRLYRNNGNGTFTEVTKTSGVDQPVTSFPCWFWDFDNDGNLDLFVSGYSSGIEHLAAEALKRPYVTQKAKLYRGDGEGRFVDVAESVKLTSPNTPMGSNFGDLDHDGRLDMYLGTGYPRLSGLMPSVLFLNRGNEGFVDVTMSSRMGNVQKGHAVVFADFDNDGDQDVFEQMGGAFPADRYYDAFYENPGFGNHWIAIRLIGKQSNRSAIGARIRIEIRDGNDTRTLYRHVNSGGSFGGNPLRQTIGLGNATRVERLEVYWPTSDLTQTFEGIEADQWIRIVEGEESFSTVKLEAFELGA
jgi:hypothetical protein